MIHRSGDRILAGLVAAPKENFNNQKLNAAKHLAYELHASSYTKGYIPVNKLRTKNTHMKELAQIEGFNTRQAALTYETLTHDTKEGIQFVPDGSKDYSGNVFEKNVTGTNRWLDVAFDQTKVNNPAYKMISNIVVGVQIGKPIPRKRAVIK